MGNEKSQSTTNKSKTTAKKIAVKDGGATSSALVKSTARTPMRIQKSPKKSKIDTSKIVIEKAEVVPDTPKSHEKLPKSSTTIPKPPKTTNSNQSKKNMKLPIIRKIHFKIRYIVTAVFILLLSAFIARVAIWEHNYLLAMEGSERHIVEPDNPDPTTDENVDATPVTETQIYEYIVAPDKPRYFSIPVLGIRKARILEITINANGELGTPYGIYDIGWYNGSSLPGNTGVSVLDGHGGYLGGIFQYLPNISAGDEILIEMGDGRIFTYAVTSAVTKAIGDDANSYMRTAMSNTPGKDTISIITCTGEYYQTSKTFSHRLFVHAQRVQ